MTKHHIVVDREERGVIELSEDRETVEGRAWNLFEGEEALRLQEGHREAVIIGGSEGKDRFLDQVKAVLD